MHTKPSRPGSAEEPQSHIEYVGLVQKPEGGTMVGTVLIVILVLALLGVLPRWSHSRRWGYAPTGGVGLILLIVVILLLLGRI